MAHAVRCLILLLRALCGVGSLHLSTTKPPCFEFRVLGFRL